MAAMTPPTCPRKRLKHYDVAGHAHLLTFSCYRRLPLLNNDRTRVWFIEALAVARVQEDFDLWAWVIMPEHVHVLLRPRQPVGTRAIAHLEQHAPAFLSQLTVVNRQRTYRRFWQPGGGWDQNLWEAKAVHLALDYIHANPVRRGFVETPEQWRWSSAADWAGAADILIRVDRTLPTLHETIG